MSTQLPHIETGRPARPGQLILQRRYRIFAHFLNELPKHRILLDIGCGNGAQTEYFMPHCDLVVGCDLIHLSQTEDPLQINNFSFVQGSALNLPFEDESVDIVTAFEVLEHVPNEFSTLQEIYRVLNPGGYFLITVPNKWWIFETHGAVVPEFNWLPWNRIPFVSWLPANIHDRIARARIYTARNLYRILESADFKVLKTGYITAPLDVLPAGILKRILRSNIFKNDVTENPILAVNLYAAAQKFGD